MPTATRSKKPLVKIQLNRSYGKLARKKPAPKGRAKCLPPVGVKTRFCHALDTVMIEDNARRSGVYTVVMTFFGDKKSSTRIFGAAARASSRVSGILFNYCPFCAGKIFFHHDPKASASHYKQLGKSGRPS